MRHRTAGRGGPKVSEIAFGTRIGRTEGSMAAALAALRLGVTTFDTADAYEATFHPAQEVVCPWNRVWCGETQRRLRGAVGGVPRGV